VLDADGRTVGTVSPLLFGAIAINKYGWTAMLEHGEALGTTFLSWPGGSIAESGTLIKEGRITTDNDGVSFQDLKGDRSNIAYDLTHTDLISAKALAYSASWFDEGDVEVAPMELVVQQAVGTAAPLSIILPVERYFVGLDFTLTIDRAMSRDQLVADLAIFLGRLNSDHWNNGVLPTRIIFEVGNEPYGNPIEYAFTARTYIEQARKAFGDRVEIAFQMNKGSAQLKTLDDMGYMDKWFRADGVPKVSELGGLRYTGYQNMTFDERQVFIEKMMIKILGPTVAEIDILRHHTLSITGRALQDANSLVNQRDTITQFWRDAITAAGGDGAAVDYYVSAWTVSSSDDPAGAQAFSMAAAPVAVMLFADFARDGVDMAQVWGILASIDYPHSGLTDTTITVHESDDIAPHGLVFGLMANAIKNMRLVENGTDDTLDYDNPTDSLVVTYEGDTSTVIYVAVGDIYTKGLTVALDLSGYSYSTVAEISMVGTETGTNTGAGTLTVTQASLSDGMVYVPFTQDYGVAQVRIRVNNFDGSNEMSGTGAADALRSTSGRDAILAHGGNDSVWGGSDNDRIYGGAGSDQLYGESGRDTLNGETGNDSLVGGDGNDVLFGGADHDTLWGQAGHDTLYGEADNDALYGDAGNDRLYAASGDDRLWGGDGHDSVWGDSGTDIIHAGTGNDRIWGGSDNDIVHGERGDDTLYAQTGDDSLWGGDGHDQILAGDGTDTVWGDTGNDDLRGEAGNDTLYGGDGDDRLYTHSGNDQALGGDGDDRFWGGAGRDDLRGDAGDDILRGEGDADTLSGGTGDDQIFGGAGNDSARGCSGNDAFWGGLGDDTLEGNDGNDWLYGQEGHDALWGGNGHDEVVGGEGNDVVNGGNGADTLDGGTGNDILDGGQGNDTLNGGAGSDRFTFTGGRDTITDFTNDTDTIALSSALWSGARPSVTTIIGAATVTAQGTVLHFADGQSLTIRGLKTPDLLVDDIVFV
jgi:Ca2+-binding RTX toxin-like protein